ncbi:hypothetical protein [Cryptosporangium sp. NPDC051539]|uniref:hypothetical protein n=1 Tax=Cryptosporangium sp. NPDC051539 TaxID=3363962 RepID=UPI0037B4F28A
MQQEPVPRPADVSITPVIRSGSRTVGAFVTTADGVRYQPVVDVERLVVGVVAVAGAAAVLGVALRPRAAVGPVSMGPGGWVSVRGARGRVPRLRGHRPEPRPWWARLLRAHRLVATD